PLRSSVVHPLTRRNEQTSCGERIPIINIDYDERDETVEIEMIPKGSGSENGSFLQMLVPADGVKAVKRFVIDKVIECGGTVARHHLRRSGGREDRGGIERGGERARHRPAGARRTLHVVPRARGGR